MKNNKAWVSWHAARARAARATITQQTLQQLHDYIATLLNLNVAQAIAMHSIRQATCEFQLRSTLIHYTLSRIVICVLS